MLSRRGSALAPRYGLDLLCAAARLPVEQKERAQEANGEQNDAGEKGGENETERGHAVGPGAAELPRCIDIGAPARRTNPTFGELVGEIAPGFMPAQPARALA